MNRWYKGVLPASPKADPAVLHRGSEMEIPCCQDDSAILRDRVQGSDQLRALLPTKVCFSRVLLLDFEGGPSRKSELEFGGGES